MTIAETRLVGHQIDRHAGGPPPVALSASLDEIRLGWMALERIGIGAPFARADFAAAWMRHLAPGRTPLVVAEDRTAGARWILPLACRRLGPVTIATPPGGSHANCITGLVDPGLPADLRSRILPDLMETLRRHRPDVDLVHLPYQPLAIDGLANPFVAADAHRAPHRAYQVDLTGGFDAILARHRGARKRKRLRANARFFEPVGGYTVSRAATAPDALAVLDAFLAQKAARFADQGLPNPFAAPGTRAFFADLIDRSAAADQPLIDCYELRAGGVIRATFIAMAHCDTLYGLMNSFAEDEFARASPGEMLVHHVIEDACGRGFQTLDLGVGDARYKRSWIDREIEMVESLIPLTAKGRLAASAIRAERRLRAAVLARPALHAALQRLRGGARTEPDRADPADD